MSKNSRKKSNEKRKKLHSRNGNKFHQSTTRTSKTFVSPGRFGGKGK